MTQLNLRSAFLHVIDGHRWLAASARTWNVVGPHVTGQAKENIHPAFTEHRCYRAR